MERILSDEYNLLSKEIIEYFKNKLGKIPKINCRDCQYYKRLKLNPQDSGECRKRAPIIIPAGINEGCFTYPQTSGEEWCGEAIPNPSLLKAFETLYEEKKGGD